MSRVQGTGAPRSMVALAGPGAGIDLRAMERRIAELEGRRRTTNTYDDTPPLSKLEVAELPWLEGTILTKRESQGYMAIKPSQVGDGRTAHALSRFVPRQAQEKFKEGQAVKYKVQEDAKGLRVVAIAQP